MIDGYPGLYPDWYKPDQVYDFGPEPSVKDMQAHAGRYQLYNLKGDMIEKFYSLDEMKANLSFTYYIAKVLYTGKYSPLFNIRSFCRQ